MGGVALPGDSRVEAFKPSWSIEVDRAEFDRPGQPPRARRRAARIAVNRST
jgi:hypothetical protein